MKTGYTFEGWNTSSDGSGTNYSANGTSQMVGGADVKLYAIWTNNVTYDGNGSTEGAVPVDSNAYIQGSTVNVLGNTGNLVKKGYTFEGWNTSSNGSGTNYSANGTFQMVGGADVKLYAIWTYMQALTVSTEGTGTVQDWSQGETKNYSIGKCITLTAVDSESSPFFHWVDGNNKVVSTSKEYTFILKNDTNLKAVFSQSADNTHLVTFKNGNGEIIQKSYVNHSDTVVFPEAPYMYGYKFNKWSIMTSEGIQAVQGDVVVTAEFTRNEGTCTITVNDGTGGGSYNLKDYVTVTANTAGSEEKFSHWKDSSGNILCYDTTYKFYATSDMALTAVYVPANQDITEQAGIFIKPPKIDAANYTISFIAERVIPEGSSIVSHGIILTDELKAEDKFIIGASGVLKVTGETTGLVGTYVLNKTNVLQGQIWYARGYIVYKDIRGVEYTVYSTVASGTI